MGETQEITDAVMYLEKAAFVTGEILHVDGGGSAAAGRRRKNVVRPTSPRTV